MFAVIETGGKQLRVQIGDLVRVESLDADVGSEVVFDQVLMVGEGEGARIGTPAVDGATVRGSVVEQGRGKKVLIYTYKKRKNSARKTQGHRQSFTAVKIDAIDA
jgi:large subunit ribosomal protein L21